MKSLEVIVRANITVKSSIKNLLLRDASTVVSCGPGEVGAGKLFFPSALALVPRTLRSPDPGDGLPGPCGRGGRGSPLVGHPPGRAGRAAGAGAAGAAAVEGEAGGRGAAGAGLLCPTRSLLSSANLHGTLVCPRDSVRLWTFPREVRCRSCPLGFDSLVREASRVVRTRQKALGKRVPWEFR